MLSKYDLQRLMKTNACPEGNLSEAVLVGAHLEGADLGGKSLHCSFERNQPAKGPIE